MRPTANNLRAHELIGLHVIVTGSADPKLRDIQGEVVDETQKMLAVVCRGVKKWIPKSTCTFSFSLPSRRPVRLAGSEICLRPEDRISKLR